MDCRPCKPRERFPSPWRKRSPLVPPVPLPVASNTNGSTNGTAATARLRRMGSEVLHELDRPMGMEEGLNASGAGPWASGRSDSGMGLMRQRSFWLVADAELIVYGATDPSASLSIGSAPVDLETDGSFRVQVPFKDGEQHYPIRAVAADGQQQRSVHLAFQRQTPEAKVNLPEEAEPAWF